MSDRQADAMQSKQEMISEVEFDQFLAHFCHEIHIDPDLKSTPVIVATEFQRFVRSDRAWVLIGTGSQCRVAAVSGISSFQRRADVVRKLEEFVRLICRSSESFSWSAGETPASRSPQLLQALDQYLDEAHVCSLRVEPIFGPKSVETGRDISQPAEVIGAVVCEWFQPSQSQIDETRLQIARQHAGIALQNALDWSRAPLAQRLRTWRRGHSWTLLTRWATGIVVLGGVVALVALIPIEFTIDAKGEMQPMLRRHVFATSAGIVRRLAVSSGTAVNEGATLLELESPELELEMSRAEGELQTTDKRIAALEASRLDFNSTSTDSSTQLSRLSGELQELRQQRDNLENELKLLSLRRDDLKVVSPIQGEVTTWDIERLLLRRPVARGQQLLTVSNVSGPWELELSVADEDSNDLLEAIKGGKPVDVEFVVITAPDRLHRTTLKSVAQTLEIQVVGDEPSLMCLANVPDDLAKSAIAGMSVRGRIHCGRRNAVTVVFGKLWRNVREHLLFPWGW